MALHVSINVPTDVDIINDIFVSVNIGEKDYIEEEFEIECSEKDCEFDGTSCNKCGMSIISYHKFFEEQESLEEDEDEEVLIDNIN